MLLGLDLGTTNIKAGASKTDGTLVGIGSTPIDLIHGPDGLAEQDIEQIWSATLNSIRQLANHVDLSEIKSIGISSQGGAMQILDANGNPRSKVIGWLDGRGLQQDKALVERQGSEWFAQRIGHGKSGMAIGQLLRLQDEKHEVLHPPYRVGFVGDIIVDRLCGRPVHDGTSCGLTLLYNPQLRTYDPDVLKILGLNQSQLPVIQQANLPAGALRSEISAETGLTAGIPVSCAVHDQYAAALGTGVIRPGNVMFGAGTAWVLLPMSDRLAPPVVNSAYVCHHLFKGVYGQILSLHTGGSAVSWARRFLNLSSITDQELDPLLKEIPPGSTGVQFWPFVTAGGTARLKESITGRFSGLQLSHTPIQAMRSVIEGLAFELRRHLDILREAQMPLSDLTMCGGAARSSVTAQMVSDISQLPVHCSAVAEGSMFGAVIMARGLIEPEKSLDELSLEMVPTAEAIYYPGVQSPIYEPFYRDYLASLNDFQA